MIMFYIVCSQKESACCSKLTPDEPFLSDPPDPFLLSLSPRARRLVNQHRPKTRISRWESWHQKMDPEFISSFQKSNFLLDTAKHTSPRPKEYLREIETTEEWLLGSHHDQDLENEPITIAVEGNPTPKVHESHEHMQQLLKPRLSRYPQMHCPS